MQEGLFGAARTMPTLLPCSSSCASGSWTSGSWTSWLPSSLLPLITTERDVRSPLSSPLLLAQRLRRMTGDAGFRSIKREQLPLSQTCPICIDTVQEQMQEQVQEQMKGRVQEREREQVQDMSRQCMHEEGEAAATADADATHHHATSSADTWTVTPCNHGFCDACLGRYVAMYGSRSRCPMCNTPILTASTARDEVAAEEGEGGGEGGENPMHPRQRRRHLLLVQRELREAAEEAMLPPLSISPMLLPDRLLFGWT